MSSQLELSWPAESQHVIFRELGTHYNRQGRYRVAASNFTKAVQANPHAVDCHYRKSVAHFRNFELKDALQSARDGLAVEQDELDVPRGENFPCSLQECKAIFELDEFEEHVKVTSNRSKHFNGHRLKDMQAELRLAFRNYDNILGKRAGPCLYEQRSRLLKIADERKRSGYVETRPEWKVKRDNKECDAVSVVEMVVKEPHVRQTKKKEKNLRMLGQVYLGHGWQDLEFLNSLRKGGVWEKTVNLPEAPESSKKLTDIVDGCYNRVETVLKSLQSRSPFYTYRRDRFGSSEKADEHLLDEIFKIRYKTFRDAYNQLDRLHELRKQGSLVELLKYANDVLWNYYQTKTERIFPDRYMFVNEICNLVGLAFVEGFQIPPTLMDERLKDRLAILFRLPLARDEDEVVVPIFGDKSTYRDPAAPDYGYIAYKNKLTVLEKRIPHSRYAIERAFLYHEMCRHHLEASKLDETRIMARRVIDEATQSGSNLWKFLGVLSIVRADCSQMNLEKLTDSLGEANQAVLALQDERLAHVIQVASIINSKLMAEKMEQRVSIQLNRIQME